MTACGGSEPDLTAATIPDDASATSVHIHEDGGVHVHTGVERSDDLPGTGEMNHDMGDMSAGDDAAHDHATLTHYGESIDATVIVTVPAS